MTTDVEDLIAHYGLHPATGPDLRALGDVASPVVVTNLFQLHDQAQYAAGDDPPCSGLEAMLRYSAVSGPRLAAVGGAFLHQGVGPTVLWGDDGGWDLVVVARYPSGAAVLDLLEDPAYRHAFRHRRAAIRRQLVTASAALG